MTKTTVAFTALFLLIFEVRGSVKDSIQYYLKHKTPELIGGMSSRNTLIGVDKTSVTGMSLGYDYGGKVKLTAGLYYLSKPLKERRTINRLTPLEQRVDEVSRFWYLGFTGDYVFYKKGKWTLNIPLRVGIGAARVRQYDINDKSLLHKQSSLIVPIESGVGALYKLTWWVGFSGGLGSRIVIGKNNSQRFSGTYYNLGVVIFFGDIYQRIAKETNRDPVKELKNNWLLFKKKKAKRKATSLWSYDESNVYNYL